MVSESEKSTSPETSMAPRPYLTGSLIPRLSLQMVARRSPREWPLPLIACFSDGPITPERLPVELWAGGTRYVRVSWATESAP